MTSRERGYWLGGFAFMGLLDAAANLSVMGDLIAFLIATLTMMVLI